MFDKLKKRMKPDLVGVFENAFTSCCGLRIVYNLDGISRYGGAKLSDKTQGTSWVAVTTPDQQKAVKALKAHGFEAVGTFKSSHGDHKCTLWLRDAE